jgi:glucoamylase
MPAPGTPRVLWAAGQVAAAMPDGAARAHLVAELRPMIDRSTTAAIAAIDNPRDLPRPSRDYWETRVREVTLGTVAPLLAGLRSAAVLYSDAGRPDVAARAASAAVRLDAAITRNFGPAGYPREIGGDDPDTAVAFLLPPFAPQVRDDVLAAWRDAEQRLRRPGGGLAPGAGWRDDGVSWTAETAIFALAAAGSGQRAAAEGWLSWLNAHRTRLGALPEQVTSSGRPASVAPLAWTDAAVVLAAAMLDSRGILVDGP